MERINQGWINARLQLNQLNVIHKLYYSKDKITMCPYVINICDRCSTAKGTLGHTFWSCVKTLPFWQDIFSCIWLGLENIVWVKIDLSQH